MSLFIAHRGLSALAPENTAAAFDMAWAHDCDGIELDVQVSADGQVVVHHDADLQRSAKANISVAASNYADLLAYDVGSHFSPTFADERIPLLKDVLTMMPAGKTIQIEIKPEVTRLDAIVELLASARKDADIYIMSFAYELLKQLHERLPALPCLWIIDEPDAQDAAALCSQAHAAGFSGLDVHYGVIDAPYVRCVHDAGLLLGCWTVNDAAKMHTLAALGVDMIASDCAHLA